MKKNISVPFLLLFFLNGFAQEKDSIFNANELGFVVTDLFNGSLQLRYERKMGKNISLAFGASYKGKEGLIYFSGIDTDHIKTSDLSYSGFKLVPEIRYYLTKTQQYGLDGFYFGAYFKYLKYYSNLNGTYINSEQTEYRIDSDADFRIFTLGLSVGYKLAITKRLNIDFVIAGPGASYHQYSLENNTTLPDEFYEDLANALEKYSLFDFLKSDFRFDLKKARTDFLVPTFRYGISVGYTF